MNDFYQLFYKTITPVFNATSTELYCSYRRFNSLSSNFLFIYSMISRTRKNSKIFSICIFSPCALLNKVNLSILLRIYKPSPFIFVSVRLPSTSPFSPLPHKLNQPTSGTRPVDIYNGPFTCQAFASSHLTSSFSSFLSAQHLT